MPNDQFKQLKRLFPQTRLSDHIHQCSTPTANVFILLTMGLSQIHYLTKINMDNKVIECCIEKSRNNLGILTMGN